MSAKEHHIASERDVRINKIAWVAMLCALVASVTIVIMQQGVIGRLVDEINEPGRPAPVVRIITSADVDLICILEEGSSNDAPTYRCRPE